LAADWYYAKDGERFGPFDAQQIKKFAEQGVLLPTDAVTRKGMPQWMPADTVKGLFAQVPQTELQSTQQAQLQPNSVETTLYQDKDVSVTTERVVLGDTVINVGDIVSATEKPSPFDFFGGVDNFVRYVLALYLSFGGLLLFGGLITVYLHLQGRGTPFGLGGAFVFFLLALPCLYVAWLLIANKKKAKRFRPSRALVIKTPQEDLTVELEKKEIVVAVSDAIHEAKRRRAIS